MIAVLGVIALGGAPTSVGEAGATAAVHIQTPRSLKATEVAHLHYVRHVGSLLIEQGSATGTLPGTMSVRCDIGSIVRASFTIYTHGGSIKGRGTATPHGAGIYESFSGSLVASGGTGRYVHAHGHAGLYGVFNRRTYALTIQTTGRLSN